MRHLDSIVYLTPGEGLGPVTIGMTFPEVLELLGKPYQSDRKGVLNRQTILIYQSGINAWLRIAGNRDVEQIGIQGDPAIQTPNGIRVGMPKNQVVLTNGKGYSEKDDILRYENQGIEFIFQAGRLYQMNVFASQPEK